MEITKTIGYIFAGLVLIFNIECASIGTTIKKGHFAYIYRTRLNSNSIEELRDGRRIEGYWKFTESGDRIDLTVEYRSDGESISFVDKGLDGSIDGNNSPFAKIKSEDYAKFREIIIEFSKSDPEFRRALEEYGKEMPTKRFSMMKNIFYMNNLFPS